MNHKPKVRGNVNGNARWGENSARSFEIQLKHGDIAGQEWAYVHRRKDLLDVSKGHKCIVWSVGSQESLIEEEIYDGHLGTMQISKRIKNWQLKQRWSDFQSRNTPATLETVEQVELAK